MDPDPDVITRELNASQESFIGALRFELKWDNDKFIELCWALHNGAKRHHGESSLPRGLSQLFWYCGTFIPRWIEQRDFQVGQPCIDYTKAVRLLRTLGDEWFGEGDPSTDTEIGNQLVAISASNSP